MPIAIGDIHGCLEQLQGLVAQLPTDETLIFLGDYIDRGPSSAGVIRYLKQLATQRPCRFLLGNHEWMMLNAIEEPSDIPIWLQNGGNPTLHSYGVDYAQWPRLAQRGTFLKEDRDFFAKLELYIEDDATIFVHAGIDTGVADMRLQEPETLLWIREKFFRNAANWKGKEVIFGHTPTTSMGLSQRSVFQQGKFHGVDTGCVYGGYLTAIDSHTHKIYQERGLRRG